MAYDSRAVAMTRRSLCARETFARTMASMKFGSATAVKIATIATTISSSTSVKAARDCRL